METSDSGGLRVDPSKVIGSLQRRLASALADAANWEAVAQEQAEQIMGLVEQRDELQAKIEQPEKEGDGS